MVPAFPRTRSRRPSPWAFPRSTSTHLQLVFAKGVRDYIEAGKDLQGKGFDPRKLLKGGRDNIVARAKELMEEFGSVNKA